jgi:hypothetical protein
MSLTKQEIQNLIDLLKAAPSGKAEDGCTVNAAASDVVAILRAKAPEILENRGFESLENTLEKYLVE